MLKITPTPPSDQFFRVQSAFRRSITERRREPGPPSTGIRHRSGARTSGFRRMVKDLISKATNNAKSRSTTSKFTLVVSEEAAHPVTASPPAEAVGKHENLIIDAVLDITVKYSSATTSNSSATNPLAMNSETGVSRGGNYQSTSQSFIDAYLARRKREEIDKLMAMLMEWMDSNRSTRGTAGSTGSSSRASPSSRASSTSGSTNQSLSGKKRTHRRDSLDGSNSGGDGNEEDKHGGKRTKVAPADTPKLACPFFKRDPPKYANRQACTGPGYSSIARLKEHIYRCHKQPENKCNRCCVAFTSGELLEEHQRADEPCKVSKDKTIDGITDAQYHQLRKKPIGTNKSNAERWEEVYRIIFPKASRIPSPYYDYDDRNRVSQGGEQNLDMEFFQNELLQGVRNDLEDRFDRFNSEIRLEFVGIVRERFELIQDQLMQGRRPKAPSSHPPPIQATTTCHPNQDAALADLDFLNFLEQPYFDPALTDFDPTLSESVNPEWCPDDVGDSAYYSADSPKSA